MDGLNLVCFLTLLFVPSLCWAIGYTCYPDNTITVSGLGSSTIAVFAKNSDGVNCTTSAAADTVNITNCAKMENDNELRILAEYLFHRTNTSSSPFGSYDGMLTNQIIGGTIIVVNITCNEIEPTGHTINNTFAAIIQYNETQAIAVAYNVYSDLDKTFAIVGEHVVWRIHFPREYYLEVAHCTANPGTQYNPETSITLISHYCTESTDLISSFTRASGVATAIINAFKFYDNDNVHLHCWLMVCPTSSGCVTSCHSGMKRQVDATGMTDGIFRSEFGQVLQIIDANANGAKPLSGLSITLTHLDCARKSTLKFMDLYTVG